MELLLNKKHELRGNGYFLGRCKENICECLTITIEDELLHTKWPYLEFKVNNGDKFSTERLVITDGVLKYDIPNGLLEDGKVKIQVVFRDETGFVWKSFVREFAVGESLCVADDLPIQYPDFITEAQVILDEYEELYDEILDGKVMSTNDFTDADKEKLDGLTNYDDTELTEKMNLRNVFEIYTTHARFKEETLGRKYNGGEQVIVLKDESYNDATIVYEYYGDPFNHFSYLGKVNINLDLGGQTLSLGTKNGILILRDNKGNWKSSIQHSVPSDSQAEECVLFLNSNSQISWMFASKYKKDGVIYPIDPTKNIDWNEVELIPDIHIRNGKVFIGEKVDETSDYGLHYDGIVNFKELHIDKVKSLPYTQAEKEKLDKLKIVPEAIELGDGNAKIYIEKTIDYMGFTGYMPIFEVYSEDKGGFVADSLATTTEAKAYVNTEKTNLFSLTHSFIIGIDEFPSLDLNAYTTPGNYRFTEASELPTISNKPVNVNVFNMRVSLSLLSEYSLTEYITQEITDKTGQKWIRTTEDNGTTWTDWDRLLTQTDYVELALLLRDEDEKINELENIIYELQAEIEKLKS